MLIKYKAPLLITLLTLVSIYSLSVQAQQQRNNGFDLANATIPADEILHGGPPRDGIPALDQPRFVAGRQMKKLSLDDRVLALDYNGVQKAYPVSILDYHEIVNDDFGGEPVLISYCPLCGTGMAFHARVDGKRLHFGVSGLLYNSDVLMYDRETESLWSQIMKSAISGEMQGNSLTMLALEHTHWGDWQRRYPKTQVLSFDTGFQRDYSRTPYAGYSNSAALYFPVAHTDRRYHPKEVVIGLDINGHKKAYPFVELAKISRPLKDQLGDISLTIHYDSATRSARVIDSQGRAVPSLTSYWFAWYAFHPSTEVFSASDRLITPKDFPEGQ
jgi:hypothetical protein